MTHPTRRPPAPRYPGAPPRSTTAAAAESEWFGPPRWQVFEHSPHAVIVTDALGMVTYWNPAAQRLYGWSVAEALGRPMVELIPSEPMHAAAQAMKDTLLGGGTFLGELEVRRRDGAAFWALVSISPVYDEGGELGGMLGISRDVTPQRERERELREAAAQAEHGTREKSELLARVSHELRTPLTAIMGYQELLARGIGGEVPPPHRTYLERIRASADYLREVVDQLLSLSRILAGKEEVLSETVPVTHFAVETAALIEPLAKARGLRFGTSVAAATGWVIRTDSGKLRQILLNLLTNAVKFTPSGSVELRLEVSDGRLSFAVQDTGVGFAPEQRELIFEPFRRLENGQGQAGSGLGLAIVERLTRLLGAELAVESEPGQGSTFRLTLPAAARIA